MRMVLTVAVILAASCAVWGDELTVKPISPAPGDRQYIGQSSTLILRTAPGALCSVDIHVVGTSVTTHETAKRAGADGIVSWPPEDVNTPGDREATARCTLNDQHAQIQWTYSVQ